MAKVSLVIGMQEFENMLEDIEDLTSKLYHSLRAVLGARFLIKSQI